MNDGRMKRTAARPLPSGRMSRAHALAFAALMGAGGVALLYEKVCLPSLASLPHIWESAAGLMCAAGRALLCEEGLAAAVLPRASALVVNLSLPLFTQPSPTRLNERSILQHSASGAPNRT